jgi:hypothetical protein
VGVVGGDVPGGPVRPDLVDEREVVAEITSSRIRCIWKYWKYQK